MGGPAPEWLLRLATIQAGMKVSDDGNTIDASSEMADWESLRKEVKALPADAPFAAWGKWLLAEPDQRPLAPGFDNHHGRS